jgi:hypothetical protein
MILERFSQHGEEEIISKYLSADKGVYVDIGSGKPKEISNTYALYKIGWRGVLVEPFIRYHEAIQSKRPEDKLCIKAITGRVGTVGMLDTASLDTIIGKDYEEKKVNSGGILHQSYGVDCYTMKEFLEEYPEVKNADFASIDIETGEEALFKCCDFNVFKPTLMCVEYQMRGVDYRPKWEYLLTPYYEPKELLGGNAFYLRK